MPLSEDLGALTTLMLSLVEDPAKLEAYRADPEGFLRSAGLSEQAQDLLAIRPNAQRPTVIIVIAVVVIL